MQKDNNEEQYYTIELPKLKDENKKTEKIESISVKSNDVELSTPIVSPIINEEPTTETLDLTKPKIFNPKDFNEQIINNDNDIIESKINPVKKVSINNKKRFTVKSLSLPFTILTFILVCIVASKAFYYGRKVNEYEEFVTEIESKLDTTARIYAGKELEKETLKNSAASSLVECINSKVDVNNLPESITSVIDKITDYYNESYNNFAFTYKDLYTGFTVSYNANQNIFAASTIKAPTDLYIYEMASEGKVNLDEELTYTSNYYNPKTGLLKHNAFNTKYTVRKLLEYSTTHSDNAAHNMLTDKFGRKNMLQFWKEKGTTAIFTQNTNWGVTNAHDATIYMDELYRFYKSNEEYGSEIMKNFTNAYPKFIKGKNDYIVANKSGWGGSAIHDVSIIFAENPYIVVALSNWGATYNYNAYFNKVNDLAYELHSVYWKYKMERCSSIKQYE